jgi:hypothetical protein
LLGSSQQTNGLPGWWRHVTASNNRGAVFSVHGRCQRFLTDTAHRLLGIGMWRFGEWKTYECRQCNAARSSSVFEESSLGNSHGRQLAEGALGSRRYPLGRIQPVKT